MPLDATFDKDASDSTQNASGGPPTAERGNRPGVQPEVMAELHALRAAGVDANLARPTPRVSDLETQERVTEAIAALCSRPDGVRQLFNPSVHPTGAAWRALAKRAIALGPLYQAGRISHLGERFDPAAYSEPLFDGRSAREILLAELGHEKAERILARYDHFLDPSNVLADQRDEFGLTSGDYLAHVVDSHAVRTRAQAAIERVERHALQRPGNHGDRLTAASLACGAAGPVLELANSIRRHAIEFDTIHLVDWDVMALASAYTLATDHEVEHLVRLHRRDLFRHKLTDYIRPHSVDVVDLLGLFEYVPSRLGHWPVAFPAAADLLASVRDILRPGGLIVLANMLRHRPQQDFFDQIWPRLQQRTVTEVLTLIAQAGFDLRDVSVDIPADEGVYAVYTIRVPEGASRRHRRSLRRRLERAAALRLITDY